MCSLFISPTFQASPTRSSHLLHQAILLCPALNLITYSELLLLLEPTITHILVTNRPTKIPISQNYQIQHTPNSVGSSNPQIHRISNWSVVICSLLQLSASLQLAAEAQSDMAVGPHGCKAHSGPLDLATGWVRYTPRDANMIICWLLRHWTLLDKQFFNLSP